VSGAEDGQWRRKRVRESPTADLQRDPSRSRRGRTKDRIPAGADLGALRGGGPGATAARAGHPGACYHFGAEDGTLCPECWNIPARSWPARVAEGGQL